MNIRNIRLVGASTVALAMMVAGGARANISPVAVAGNPAVTSPSAGLYNWTYTIQLDNAQTLEKGDFFTIYDFAGFTGTYNIGGSTPNVFTLSSANSSGTITAANGKLDPTDDPNIANYTFTWQGSNVVGTGPGTTGQVMLQSIYNTPALVTFVGFAHNTITTNTNVNNTQTYAPHSSPVPEPTSVASFGLGGFGLLGLMLRARKARRTAA